MKKLTSRIISTFISLVLLASSQMSYSQGENNMITMITSLGEIKIELYPEDAPVTVENFIEYANAGHFDGLIFHRVIPGFVVQGGGFTPDMQQRETRTPIQNEADNGLKNLVGTLSMARTPDPNSATSQFFINLVDNAFLDHTAKNAQGWGYAVFAKVVEGMDVVEQMAQLPTGQVGPYSDVPLEPIIIEQVTVASE